MPQHSDAAHGVGEDGGGRQFTVRSQPVDKLGVGGQENVVRGSIFNLLRENATGGGDEADVGVGFVFAKCGAKVWFEVGEVGSGGDGKDSGTGENRKKEGQQG